MGKINREPSLHITESALRQILEEAEIDEDLDDLVKFILTRGCKYRLNNRKILVNNKKDAKRANNINASSSGITEQMIKAISLVRRRLKHKGIVTIKPGTREFTVVKQIAANADLFYKEYFDKTESQLEAFIEYIQIFINSQGGKFNLTRIPGAHESICKAQENITKIAQNEYPELTKELLYYYNKLTIEQTGTLFLDYSNIPDKYIYFMQAADICKKFGVSANTFMVAQFESLKWANTIPEPHQLITDRALGALQKYLYQNPELIEKKQTIKKELVNRLKNIGNGSNRNKK